MNEPNRFDHKKKYVKQRVVNEDFHRFVNVYMRLHCVHVNSNSVMVFSMLLRYSVVCKEKT